MQQLYDHWRSPVILMALCNMYLRAQEWDEIVHVAAGVSNKDDITLIIRLQQAEALERQGFPDAALEAYRDAVKSKRRNQELLKRARYGRAVLYSRIGKRGMAKRDLARIYADDPDYKDVSALLQSLG
jgi:tetratricopeptide (TPR) repeat protein